MESSRRGSIGKTLAVGFLLLLMFCQYSPSGKNWIVIVPRHHYRGIREHSLMGPPGMEETCTHDN